MMDGGGGMGVGGGGCWCQPLTSDTPLVNIDKATSTHLQRFTCDALAYVVKAAVAAQRQRGSRTHR